MDGARARLADTASSAAWWAGCQHMGGEARARMGDDGGEGGMSAEAQHVEVGEIGGDAESDRSVWVAWSTWNGDGKRRGGG